MKTLFIRILRFLMLLIFIASCGIGYVIYEDTLTAWWIPLGMALLIALVTIPFYKKWIWLTTLACIGAISYVLFLGGNYWFADPASTHEETVMVQKKYVETHKKTRRVGRHRYVSDGIRKEYYLQVAFENGAVEELHVSLSTYNKAKAGASKILTLQKGFFGLPVITKGL